MKGGIACGITLLCAKDNFFLPEILSNYYTILPVIPPCVLHTHVVRAFNCGTLIA